MIKKLVLLSVMSVGAAENVAVNVGTLVSESSKALVSESSKAIVPEKGDIIQSIANGLSQCVCNHTAYASLGAVLAMETLDCYKSKFEHKSDQKVQNFMKSLGAVALVPVSMVATTWICNQFKSVITPAVAAGLTAACIINKYVKDLPQMKDMAFKIGAVTGCILIAKNIMEQTK